MAVVGSSTGGRVALALVDEVDARLQGLLLANARVTPGDATTLSLCHELAAEVATAGVDVVADEFLPKLLGTTTQRTRAELITGLRAMIRENTPNGIAGVLRTLVAREQTSAALHRIRCPVVCVGGEEDVLTPSSEIRSTAEQIPGAPYGDHAGGGSPPRPGSTGGFR